MQEKGTRSALFYLDFLSFSFFSGNEEANNSTQWQTATSKRRRGHDQERLSTNDREISGT